MSFAMKAAEYMLRKHIEEYRYPNEDLPIGDFSQPDVLIGYFNRADEPGTFVEWVVQGHDMRRMSVSQLLKTVNDRRRVAFEKSQAPEIAQ